MPQAAEVWTAERIRALPDDRLRHEVVDGEHLVSPAPQAPHQIAVFELMMRLDPYVREHSLGRVMHSPADLEFDPEVLEERLGWRPDPSLPPLVLDLVALFREVHGEE